MKKKPKYISPLELYKPEKLPVGVTESFSDFLIRIFKYEI